MDDEDDRKPPPRGRRPTRKERMERKMAEINEQDRQQGSMANIPTPAGVQQSSQAASSSTASDVFGDERMERKMPALSSNSNNQDQRNNAAASSDSHSQRGSADGLENRASATSFSSNSSIQRGNADGLESRASATSLESTRQRMADAPPSHHSPSKASAARRSRRTSTESKTSNTRRPPVLLEMSMDEMDDSPPVDVNLTGPVVSVDRHARNTSSNEAGTASSTSASAAASRIVVSGSTSAPLPPAQTTVIKERVSATGSETQGPGAYEVQGRAIGSAPVWIRQFGRSARNLRTSARNLRPSARNLRPSARNLRRNNDQSHLPPEMRVPVSDPNVPPELRAQANSSVPPELQGINSEQPEFGGPDQDEHNLYASVEVAREAPTKNRKLIWCAVLAIVVLGGVGAGVGVAVSSGAENNEGLTNAAEDPTQAPVPTPAPTACDMYYENLTDAHRSCLCIGSVEHRKEGNGDDVLSKYIDLYQNIIPSLNFDPFPGSSFDSPSCAPNNVALFWLAEDIVENNSPEDTWVQRFLLASLFLSWTDQDPFLWETSSGWLAAGSECEWFGVVCDDSGQVEKLQLSNNNLLEAGGLPNEIFQLTSLKNVDLSSNGLYISSIPNDIIQLQSLESLNLGFNTVKGILPFEFFPTSIGESFGVCDDVLAFII